MLYIHHIFCVSPQKTLSQPDLETLNDLQENKLKALEPAYEGIPVTVLRRMGKAVRMSVGAASSILKTGIKPDGIILGTANGGMEDCIKFMIQIAQYDEGLLTPGNFVQSTPNGLAAQLALSQHNTGYNITHTHRGLSFENAVIDASMMLREFPSRSYLLGAADEISTYNYNVDFLDGWYKKENISNKDLYGSNSLASIAGEGAVMCLASNEGENAVAKIVAVHTIHGEDEEYVGQELRDFLSRYCITQVPDLFISGENGDNRFQNFYLQAEKHIHEETGILRFKHMSGEYPTASSFAVWLSCYLLQGGKIPSHCIKRNGGSSKPKSILIYNHYKGVQHSLILLSAP